jgi:hypothetical protein
LGDISQASLAFSHCWLALQYTRKTEPKFLDKKYEEIHKEFQEKINKAIIEFNKNHEQKKTEECENWECVATTLKELLQKSNSTYQKGNMDNSFEKKYNSREKEVSSANTNDLENDFSLMENIQGETEKELDDEEEGHIDDNE